MLKFSFTIALRDLRLVFSRGAGIVQAFLLGLLLIFLFSLSLNPGDVIGSQTASAVFWLSTAFCQVLLYNSLYAIEESAHSQQGLLLLPIPVQAVWLGKVFAGFLLLLIAQCVFFPALFVFFNQHIFGNMLYALIGVLLVNIGLAASGSLLGALSTGKTGRESLLSVIVFPLLIPLLLAGVRLLTPLMTSEPETGELAKWIGIAGAFDAVFLSAGLFLFPFVFSGDNS